MRNVFVKSLWYELRVEIDLRIFKYLCLTMKVTNVLISLLSTNALADKVQTLIPGTHPRAPIQPSVPPQLETTKKVAPPKEINRSK